MSASLKAQEPSMEEILASIRRIIADEEPLPPPGRHAPADPAAYAPKRHDEPRRYEDAPARGAPPRWDPRDGEPRDARHADSRGYEQRPRDPRRHEERPPEARPQDLRPQEPRPEPRRPELRGEFRQGEPRHFEPHPFDADPRRPEARRFDGEPEAHEPERLAERPGDRMTERRPRPLPPRDMDDERPVVAPRRAAEPRDLRETLARPSAPGAGAGALQPPPMAPPHAAPQPMGPQRATVTSLRPPPAPEEEMAPGRPGRRKDLLSPAVDAAVTAAFGSLGDLVLPHQDRTVEDLVKEILRPMLKEWLDKNLPDIVERLVRQEIERVSRTTR